MNYFRQYGTSPIERYYVAGNIAGNLSTLSYANDFIIAAPLVMPKRSHIDRVGIRVLGGAAGTARIGIYNATSGTNMTPWALLYDSGNIDTSSNGFKTATVDWVLEQDTLYWAALLMSDNGVTIRSVPVASAYPILGYDNTLDASVSPGTGWSATFLYAALPPTFPPSPGIYAGTGGLPAIGYRLAL
jgi:hypothetical protein